MPTKTTPHPVLQRSLFGPGSKYGLLDHNSEFIAMAMDIPGFADLIDQANRAWSIPEIEVEHYDQFDAVSDFVEGADLLEVARKATVNNDEQAARLASTILAHAKVEVSSRAELWLSQNEAAVCAGLRGILRGIYDEARDLATGPLKGVYTADHLALVPNVSDAYVRLAELSARFKGLHTVVKTIAVPASAPAGSAPQKWPLAEIIGPYREAYPEFWTFRGAVGYDVGGLKGMQWVAPQSVPPWPSDPTNLLRYVAENGLRPWAPTRAQYRQACEGLDKDAVARAEAAVSKHQVGGEAPMVLTPFNNPHVTRSPSAPIDTTTRTDIDYSQPLVADASGA